MDYMYSYDGGGSTGSMIFSLLLNAALLVANWFLFEKAGEDGWKSIVPIYSLYKQFEIVYGNGWKFLLLLVPILNLVVGVAFSFRFAQAYGKGILFGFGMLFFSPIFTLILAFGSAKYHGPTYSFI